MDSVKKQARDAAIIKRHRSFGKHKTQLFRSDPWDGRRTFPRDQATDPRRACLPSQMHGGALGMLRGLQCLHRSSHLRQTLTELFGLSSSSPFMDRHFGNTISYKQLQRARPFDLAALSHARSLQRRAAPPMRTLITKNPRNQINIRFDPRNQRTII